MDKSGLFFVQLNGDRTVTDREEVLEGEGVEGEGDEGG